jgi:hypothetical protein
MWLERLAAVTMHCQVAQLTVLGVLAAVMMYRQVVQVTVPGVLAG